MVFTLSSNASQALYPAITATDFRWSCQSLSCCTGKSPWPVHLSVHMVQHAWPGGPYAYGHFRIPTATSPSQWGWQRRRHRRQWHGDCDDRLKATMRHQLISIPVSAPHSSGANGHLAPDTMSTMRKSFTIWMGMELAVRQHFSSAITRPETVSWWPSGPAWRRARGWRRWCQCCPCLWAGRIKWSCCWAGATHATRPHLKPSRIQQRASSCTLTSLLTLAW